MSFVRSLVADLVERRLWPVAIALLAALVAVPLLLSKSAGEGVPPSPPPPGSALLGSDSAKLLGETRPAVSVRGEGGFRKHVGRLARKNPFIQQARSGGGKSEAVTLPTGTTGDTGSTGEAPTTTTPTGQPVRLYRYQAELKFGRIGSAKAKTVDPGDFLPSEQNPVTLYVASSDSGDKALFLVTPTATVRGDGECSPSSSDCQLLTMRKGNVEFFEVPVSEDTVVTYELELVDIVLKEVKSPPKTQSKPVVFQPNSRSLERMRQAMRTKRVFNALDKLGF